MKRFRLLRPAAALLSCCACLATAGGRAAWAQTAPAAPNAGGYAGDFGSDFGVGQAETKGIREPVVVAGVSSTVYGKPVPWLGLRFADELSFELRAPMRKSADASGVSQFLAARRIAPWQVSPDTDSATPSAANALRTWPRYRDTPLIVVGQVTLSGKDTAPATTIRVRLRALRWDKSALRAASGEVSLSAPLGEWPQLPTRAALALLDALRVPLVEDERIEMLRRASPLQPPATAQRLRLEKLAGEMQYQALRCQYLSQAQPRETAYAKAARLRSAKVCGSTAVRNFTTLKKVKFGGDMPSLRETPGRWQAYVYSVSRLANTRFQALPVALRKAP